MVVTLNIYKFETHSRYLKHLYLGWKKVKIRCKFVIFNKKKKRNWENIKPPRPHIPHCGKKSTLNRLIHFKYSVINVKSWQVMTWIKKIKFVHLHIHHFLFGSYTSTKFAQSLYSIGMIKQEFFPRRHWGWDKMATILQKTFSNWFFGMKIVFWWRFHIKFSQGSSQQ